MSETLTASGLQSSAGLFGQCGVYKFDRNGSIFNPLDLNPYLLFDAQTSMIGTLENPTLDLDPSKQETLDVITATRAGAATYTDFNGLIATAQSNTVRVDQTQGAELTPTKFQRVGYTDFSSGWAASGATISNTAPYDSSAAKRVSVTGFGLYYSSTPVSNSTQYTATFYARLVSGSSSNVKFYTSSTGATYTALTLTSEWQKFTKNITTTGTSVNFGIANTAGSEPVVFEISQPQLEEGTTASDFVANTSTSAKFITGATFGPRSAMILVELSATNLVTYSEDFSNAAWSKSGAGTGVAPIVTPNSGTSPDGTLSASRIQFNKGSGTGHTNMSIIFDAEATSSGATTSKSVYLKSNTTEAYEMVIYETTDASGTNLKKITVTPDWQRFQVYGSISSSTTGISIGLREINVSGLSNTADVLVWGAQLETGSVSTSYIPTSGSTAQRAKDDLVITGSAFSDFYNSGGDGTFYVEFTPKDFTVGEQYLLRGGDSNRRIIYSNGTISNIRSYDGVNVLTMSNTVESNVFHRIAVSFNSSTMKGSLDGATEVTSTHNGNLLTSTMLEVGKNYKGHIKRLIFWPYSSDNL